VSKGTQISVDRFLIEYFTPLSLGEQLQGSLSDEDVTEVWLSAKSEAISKVSRTKGGVKGAEAHCPDVKEVEKTFWIIRSDDWVINKKTKHIVILEFKRVSDTAETDYSDMQSIAERQHTPILEGLNALAECFLSSFFFSSGFVSSLFCTASVTFHFSTGSITKAAVTAAK